MRHDSRMQNRKTSTRQKAPPVSGGAWRHNFGRGSAYLFGWSGAFGFTKLVVQITSTMIMTECFKMQFKP